jgi:hypothetical protein
MPLVAGDRYVDPVVHRGAPGRRHRRDPGVGVGVPPADDPAPQRAAPPGLVGRAPRRPEGRPGEGDRRPRDRRPGARPGRARRRRGGDPPGQLWNDTTSTPEARELVDTIGRNAWARRAGSVPVAAFTVTKLLWLRRHEPENFHRLRRVALPHDWLNLKLTGRQGTDRSEASGTGYFSPATGTYDLDLLALVDPDRDWAGALSRWSARRCRRGGRGERSRPNSGCRMASSSRRAPTTTRRARSPTGCGRATPWSPSAPRGRCSPPMASRSRTLPGRSTATPTQQAPSSRSFARSTRPR